MARDSRLSDPLDNYDLTRKVFAARTLAVLIRQVEEESRKPSPDLAALASLGTAVAALLAAVG